MQVSDGRLCWQRSVGPISSWYRFFHREIVSYERGTAWMVDINCAFGRLMVAICVTIRSDRAKLLLDISITQSTSSSNLSTSGEIAFVVLMRIRGRPCLLAVRFFRRCTKQRCQPSSI